MFLSLLSHLLCAYFAFALPCYATYKALARPAPADTLQALAMYWAVLGAFVALEQSVGLFLSWLPFYWELRTLFLLYISLPQTQGAAYVYKTCLEPWCSRHEADLDAAMTSAQTNALAFCRARIAALFDLVGGFLNSTPSNDAHEPAHPIDQLKGIWAAYAPSVLAAFAPPATGDAHAGNGSHDEVYKPYSAN